MRATEPVNEPDRARAYHTYRDDHSERFTLGFHLANGDQHAVAYRHFASLSHTGSQRVFLRFATSEIELVGKNLGPLVEAIRYREAAFISEQHCSPTLQETEPYVSTISIVSI